jgi:hypothetical protein
LGELKQSNSKGKKERLLSNASGFLPAYLPSAGYLLGHPPHQFFFELAAYEVNWLKVELVLAPII